MAYLDEEIDAGRMSGRFTLDEVERICGGPVYVSPLLVAVSTQQPGAPDKIRICRHLSKSTPTQPSVNSFIQKEDFPTRLDMALRVAEVVSLSLSFSIPIPPSIPLYLLFIILSIRTWCIPVKSDPRIELRGWVPPSRSLVTQISDRDLLPDSRADFPRFSFRSYLSDPI